MLMTRNLQTQGDIAVDEVNDEDSIGKGNASATDGNGELG